VTHEMNEKQKEPLILRWLDRLLIWVSLTLGGLTLAGMTLLSVWNVLIMRKAFNNPIQGAEDVLIVALVAVVALAVPLGARTGAHIEIEVLESRMSPGFAKWSHVLTKVAGATLLMIMAWRLMLTGQSAVRFGETTQQLMISYEPFYYLLAVSVFLYAWVLMIDIWQLVQGKRINRLNYESQSL